MPLFDLPFEDLVTYRPHVAEPDDFDEFWARTLSEARGYDLALRAEPVDSGLRHVDVSDVTFAGFGGHPIKGWYARPAGVREDLPVVVNYIGYSGGRGRPHEHTLIPAAGYAYLIMDTRGQGYSGSGGATPDPVGHGPARPGFLTRGLRDPQEYYYRRLYTDAARAVEVARELPGTDPARVVVSGGSQGGGIAIAAAALVPDVQGVLADVPFMQHVRRAVEITPATPYAELSEYLAVHREEVEQVWRTISYVDGVNLARRAVAPALYSVALMDMVCPPSTVYASFNHYGERAAEDVEKRIEVWSYNGHEGGGAYQRERALAWLRELFA
ncbi:MAG: alpha/beta fold hydrolase [Actinomycetales bacterium]|nr:alpha/beta fold hydrolase [Actinomycetales bacterium]